MEDATEHLPTYYQRHFPAVPFCDLLSRAWRGHSVLHKREICVENTDGCYIRWQSVDNAASLLKLFKEKRVEKLHTGAIFSEEPRFKKRNPLMHPIQRELVFDIDVNDVGAFGVDPNDIESCDRVWPVVATQMRILKRLLIEHFDFKHFLLVYSGRRGAHLSVYDERACVLSDAERASIVEFLQPSCDQGKLNYSRLVEYIGFKSIYDCLVLPMWKSVFLKPQSDGGMGVLDSAIDHEVFMDLLPNDFMRKTAPLNGRSGIEAWTILTALADKSPWPESAHKCLQVAVMHYLWPRLDANVTQKMNHLNKAVFSVHPKTGRICVPVLGVPLSFEPAKCPKFREVVESDGDARTRFENSVRDFGNFLARLKTCTKELQPPPGVLSKKRLLHDDSAGDVCVSQTRVCAPTTRVFAVVAAENRRGMANVFFYTKFDESCVHEVWAGYETPHSTRHALPMEKLRDMIKCALKEPGRKFEFGETQFDVLFHPGVSKEMAHSRMRRIKDRLGELQSICCVGGPLVGDASDVAKLVRPVWDASCTQLS